MTTSKSHFKQLLSKKVCIDCLKPRSNKNRFEYKSCDCTDFYVFNYETFPFKILPSL